MPSIPRRLRPCSSGCPPPKRKAVEALREDFGGAPYMVAVVCRASDDPMLQHENQLSVATAVQNLCLVASAHGVGSIWLSVGAAPPVKPLLGLEPDRVLCRGGHAFGAGRRPLAALSKELAIEEFRRGVGD